MPKELENFKNAFIQRFLAIYGKEYTEGSSREHYKTLALLARDEISRKWRQACRQEGREKPKEVWYFSIEFLTGRFLMNNLHYLGWKETAETGLKELGLKLEEIKEAEEDPGLGNGGLGRLASSFLDSLACLGLSGFGCGIRYRYGLFEQTIINGEQAERPDNWLSDGCVWEYRRPEEAETVKFGGFVRIDNSDGRIKFIHENYDVIRAVPYDIPILGYQNDTVNFLRLWSAESDKIDFEFHTFSRGEYAWAFHEKIRKEAVSQVLYPDDSTTDGKLLRLRQQYFFVSAGLQSILRRLKKTGRSLTELPRHLAVHINDTHPALGVAELMRILLDEEGLGWDEAWNLTVQTVSYTNHTLLPEALEKWPVDLFRELLPRIYMIVEEINNRFCLDILNSEARFRKNLREMAVIADGTVKMANLAIVGSHSVNGVAQLHTEIMKKRVMNNFNEYYPRKFNNKTNGISQRRWLLIANPALSSLLHETVGPGWIEDPARLEKLADFAEDAAVQERIARIKQQNKEKLTAFIYESQGLRINPESIFDIHIKRIHMYKRQLLNAFHIMALYNRLRQNPTMDLIPRTFIFGGKAAPAYYLAKQVIKLLNTLAYTINNDKKIRGKIKVIFLPNYNVSLAERLFPAADVSEQISTASKEASGTGNMKFVMNGAVTIGTLDGANVEIREKVGADNFILFGLSAEEVLDYHVNGGYNAWEYYQQDARIKTICDQLNHGWYNQTAFPALCNHLLANNDEFFVLRDFDSYVQAQKLLEKKFREPKIWRSMCICNIAHSGSFSSDRSIREYAREIWELQPARHTILKETKKK